MIQTADASTINDAEAAGMKTQKISGSSSTIILLNNKRAPTDDVRVRRALAYAIDRDAVIKVTWAGTREPSYSAFGTKSPYFVDQEDAPRYDQDKARALLKEYGKPISITLECIPTPEADQVLAVVKQMWEAVGIKVSLISTEQGQFVTKMFGTKDYVTACFRNSQFVDPDEIYNDLHSGGSANISQYSNAIVDKGLDDGRATSDLDARKKAYAAVQAQIAKDVPSITLAYDLFANIYKPAVHGLPAPEANSLGAIKPATLWMSS
jgi:ABC-type transport system substrate-binding protein